MVMVKKCAKWIKIVQFHGFYSYYPQSCTLGNDSFHNFANSKSKHINK